MRAWLAAGCTCALALVPSASRAFEGEVTSDTTTQFYDVRSPTGQPILMRRRLTTTLGVLAYDLLKRPEGVGQEKAPELSFRARLRYDADYGASSAEATPSAYDRYVAGFSRGPVDFMYAYVEGRRFLHGLLDFKLGRQYQVDALGYWSFDGAEVRVTTPAFFAVEAYGGLEVRGGLPASGALGRWSQDGVWRGDRSNFDPTEYPEFENAEIAPAFGAAIESSGITWLHGRLSYRRVYNTGDAGVALLGTGLGVPVVPYSDTRISQERLGYTLSASLPKVGGVNGGMVYDLYDAAFTSIYGTAEAFLGSKVIASVDYDFFRPSFDGDSIFNFFAMSPMNDVGGRVAVMPTDRWALSASGHVRAFDAQTSDHLDQPATTPYPGYANNGPVPAAPNVYGAGVTFDGGGTLGVRYRRPSTTVTLQGAADVGDAGDRVGADLFGQRIYDTHYVLSARLGFWHWNDKLRPDRSAASLAYVLGLGYRFFGRSQVGVEMENDINRLVGLRFRTIAYLQLAVSK